MKHIIAILSLIIFSETIAQDIALKATAPSTVSTGSQFKIVYSVNAKPSSFKNPSFEPFEILMGPSTSSNTSISFINGQMTQDVSYSYTFYLTTSKEGKFTIPPAEVVVNGKTYKSNSVQIEVIKGNATPPVTSNQTPSNAAGNASANVSNEDVFIRIIVNKNHVYESEQLIASVYIYTRLNIVGFEELKFPTMTGFWSKDLETPNQIQLKQEYINGQLYNVGLLKSLILSPTRSGNITIDPVQATVVVQQRVQSRRRSIFDDFFGTYQTVSKKLVSSPVTIQVKPLLPNQPEPFSGGVGNFSLETKVDTDNLKMNEAFNYTIHLKGAGNINLLEIPKPKFPPDFEVYEPKTTENINIKESKTQGTKSVSYIIIPRHHGQFTIPGLTFNYFDLNTKSYKTIQTEPINIQVSKDSIPGTIAVISQFSKKDISILGSDIRHIKTNVEPLKKTDFFVYQSLIYKASYPVALLVLLTLLYIRKEQIKQRSNIIVMRNKKANKVANKRLKQAKKFLTEQNSEKFYEEINRALWGYISDKLMIPTSELNKEVVIEKLKNKNVNDEFIVELFNTIEMCEFARYALSSINISIDNIYNQATNHINHLENCI